MRLWENVELDWIGSIEENVHSPTLSLPPFHSPISVQNTQKSHIII